MAISEKILNRIKIMQDMASRSSTPENERTAALLKIRQLMKIHSIRENDLPKNETYIESIWILSKSSYKWEQYLAAQLGYLFGYKVYTNPGKNSIIYAGLSDEVEIHSQVFYSVMNQIKEKSEWSWGKLINSTKIRKHKKSFKRSFCEAAAQSFIWKLTIRAEAEKENERNDMDFNSIWDEDDPEESEDYPEEFSIVIVDDLIKESIDDITVWFEDKYNVYHKRTKEKERKQDYIASSLGNDAGYEIEPHGGLKS